jgi:hypothetical protein
MQKILIFWTTLAGKNFILICKAKPRTHFAFHPPPPAYLPLRPVAKFGKLMWSAKGKRLCTPGIHLTDLYTPLLTVNISPGSGKNK